MRKFTRYGQSTATACPFCGRSATVKNTQGVPVCIDHRESSMEGTCACGGSLELRDGQWGPYFLCRTCGPVSMKKAQGAGAVKEKNNEKSMQAKTVRADAYKNPDGSTKYVRSDDPRFDFR